MQLLRIFCITAFVLIIASSSSSNIPFKSDNDINTKASIIDSRSFFLSVHDKVSFSSLLQPIDAQEQEEHEVEQVEEVEETPAEERPAEERPAEERPAEERPAEEVEEISPPAIDNDENNTTSFDGFSNITNVPAMEDRLSIECQPTTIEMQPGQDASINCTVENKSSDPIEIIMEYSGLEGTGIECYSNGEYPIRRTLTEMSDTNFSIILVSSSSPPVTAGSYPFIITLDVCVNSDLC